MSKEIEKVNAEAEAQMAAMYGGQESSPLRRVKLHKKDRKISYYLNDENVDLPKPELKLTIIGIMRKYELRGFDDDKNITHSFATTEFPYAGWDSTIKVLDYTVKGETKVLCDGVTASEFKLWCEEHDEEGRENAKKGVPFVQFSKYYGADLGTTFKPLTILYGVDSEKNLYRVELTSSSKESLWAALKKYTNKIPFYQPTTIKFEKEVTTTPMGDFYKPVLEVGKAYETKEKLEYMKLAQDFVTAIVARQKAGGQKQTPTPTNDAPFESEPKQIEEAESLDDVI